MIAKNLLTTSCKYWKTIPGLGTYENLGMSSKELSSYRTGNLLP